MLAWTLVALGALLWFIVVWYWLRGPWPLRLWVGLLIPVWSLSPAAVENHPEDIAPAIFAAFYELFIAPEGNPGIAIAVLVLGTIALTLAVALVHFAKRLIAKSGRGLIGGRANAPTPGEEN